MTATDRYLYLGGDALHTGMYVALIQRLEQEGLSVDLVSRVKLSLNPAASWAAWSDRDRIGPNSVAAMRGQIRGAIHALPIWSPLPGLSAPLLGRVIGPGARDRRVVLHTRQIVMGRLALSYRRRDPAARVIVELEGDNVAEARYKHALLPHPTRLQAWRREAEERFYHHHEGRLLVGSDAVVCVSHKLKEVMVRRYQLSDRAAGKIHVFPSVASRERFAFHADRREQRRQALGLAGRYIVIYSGNLLGRWQVPDKLVELFQLIRRSRPDAYFLILAPEDHWQHILPHLAASRLPAADYRLTTCPHAEVVDYLCAADVGLLLRDRHPMNEVAAPGKFAEYVLSGLPTILTDGIGDFSETAKQAECACVLPGLEDLGASSEVVRAFCGRDFSAGERAAFSRWGGERFAIELYIPRLAALYRSVGREGPG